MFGNTDIAQRLIAKGIDLNAKRQPRPNSSIVCKRQRSFRNRRTAAKTQSKGIISYPCPKLKNDDEAKEHRIRIWISTKPGTNQKKLKSGEKNCVKQKLGKSDIKPSK
jgi:hypothetical protein